MTRLWQDLLHERKQLVADLIADGVILQIGAVCDVDGGRKGRGLGRGILRPKGRRKGLLAGEF